MARSLLVHAARLCCVGGLVCLALPCPAAWDGFTATGSFGEQLRELRTDDDVRIVVNAADSAHFDAARPTTLIIYALPNGNTIEQTMGCKRREGIDWHFDIQHIAAQTRVLRKQMPNHNIVAAYFEAGTLSWPAWRATRPDHPRRLAALVDEVAAMIPDDDIEITLAAHSGGGAFVLGYLDAADAIRANTTRIAFLDANYSFDAEQHGGKLLAWLQGQAERQLVVLAYDDREITYQGKRVVGPTGGTFRATRRMRDRFAEEVGITESTRGPFTMYDAVDRRLHMLVHANPNNKILHTALVGDMNGFLYALTHGTPHAEQWGQLGGPRAYTEFIAPLPEEPWSLPERRTDAESGTAFVARVKDLAPADREQAIVEAVLAGNFPEHLRKLHPVRVAEETIGGEHVLIYQAMPDYLAIGSDDDFVRMPMTPQSAQRIADEFGMTLPTAMMVDQIYSAAAVKLAPRPLTEHREAVETFAQHHRWIENQRRGHPLGQLVAGTKKDVVLTNRIAERAGRVAIYGWHRLSGAPIQPLTTVHTSSYVDYSHGVRLVRGTLLLDDQPATFAHLARAENLHPLVSDEGPLTVLKYPLPPTE